MQSAENLKMFVRPRPHVGEMLFGEEGHGRLAAAQLHQRQRWMDDVIPMLGVVAQKVGTIRHQHTENFLPF